MANGRTESKDAERPGYDWAELVPVLIHPIKVGIIEALWRIDRPLSATDLAAMFDGGVELSHVSYHVQSLAKARVIVKVAQRQSRGALQKFYRLP